MFLAGKLSKFEIVDWEGRQPKHQKWWDVFVEDLNIELLEDICHQVLDLYSIPIPDTPQDSPPPSPSQLQPQTLPTLNSNSAVPRTGPPPPPPPPPPSLQAPLLAQVVPPSTLVSAAAAPVVPSPTAIIGVGPPTLDPRMTISPSNSHLPSSLTANPSFPGPIGTYRFSNQFSAQLANPLGVPTCLLYTSPSPRD